MNRIRTTLLGAAVLGATLTGGAVGASFLGGSANAATSDTTTAAAATTSGQATATSPTPSAGQAGAGAQRDPSKGGHVANGITEAILTGETADKVTAAAKVAVPDGTIERVENDAEGAVYEAHMVKADGTHVTVKFAADFSVSGIESK